MQDEKTALNLEDQEMIVEPETTVPSKETEQDKTTTETSDIVVFISGTTDVNEKDFMQYYFPVLNMLSKSEQKIYYVMSDDDGVAVLAQMCLNQLLTDRSVVSVFCIDDTPKNYISQEYVCVAGFKTIEERDAAMTASSNKDLHVILEGQGRSAVEHNVCRRLTPKYDYRKFLTPEYNLPFWGILFNVITPEKIKEFQEQAQAAVVTEEKPVETTEN